MIGGKSIIKIFGLFMVLTLLGACISDLDYESSGEVQDAISIQAKLVKGNPSIISVEVKRVFDFTGVTTNIKVQSVTLFDEDDNYLDIPNTGIAEYELVIPENDPDFSVDYLRNYNLEVVTLDGKRFRSSPEPLIPVAKADGLDLTLINVQEPNALNELEPVPHVEISVNTPVTFSPDGSRSRFRWSFQETYRLTDAPEDNMIEPKTCYLTQSLGSTEEASYDPNERGEDYISSLPLFQRRVSDVHSEGNYMTVVQHSLSEPAYQYFDQIGQLLERSGSLFSTPAGRIVTNFSNTENPDDEVFGYFYATEIDTIRVYIAPDAVGSPPPRCPPTFETMRACPLEECCDCLDVDNSTTIKPSWWTE
jgi:hypothetical protein